MRIRQEQIVREMMLEGVISILEGMNPRMIETKLLGFFAEANNKAQPAKGGHKPRQPRPSLEKMA